MCTAAHVSQVGVVEAACTALAAGSPVVVHDMAAGGGADVILSAAMVDTRWMAWSVRWTSGFLYAALPAEVADRLELPRMTGTDFDDSMETDDYRVSVDAASGITTGISAADRGRTARVLADPHAVPGDLTRPGHLIPIRVREGGVLTRPARPEAATDLCRIAGVPAVAIGGELVADDGKAVDDRYIADFSTHHGIPVVEMSDLIDYRLFRGDGKRGRVIRVSEDRISTEHGFLETIAYRDEVTGAEHTAIRQPGAVRISRVTVHIECPLCDVFGALSCSCGSVLSEEMGRLRSGSDLLVYLRITPALGHGVRREREPPGRERAFEGTAAAILRDLGIHRAETVGGPVGLGAAAPVS